ncbi:MAG: uroporphyrinogen-III synthase [Thermoanaerobaculia bacterium]
MSRPRALVVRSGANPFLSDGGSDLLEVVEKASHAIERADPPAGAFAAPTHLAIFTSQVAVERVAADVRLTSLFSRAISGGRVAAVGAATAQALRAHGIPVGLVAEGSAKALLERLPARLDGWRVLLPCGDDAAEELPEALQLRGARVERAVVYRKVLRPRDAGLEREILERPFAAFCTTSPSAAQWLFEGLGDDAADRLRRTPAVALGQTTRRALEARGVLRVAVSGQPLFPSVLALLERLATAPGGG